MRTTTTVAADHRGENESECFAIQRLQLLEYEYRSALRHLEKEQEDASFSFYSDIVLPVSLLFLIVIWGYQLNAMTVDTDDGEDRTMLLVCGVGLIVISGTACVYIAIRMTMVRPKNLTAFLSATEIKPLYTEHNDKRSQKYYYQTIPGIHRSDKKPTVDIFIV